MEEGEERGEEHTNTLQVKKKNCLDRCGEETLKGGTLKETNSK